MLTVYFAGGCFWGTQHYFKQIKGVVNTCVGYANSTIPHPTYHEVCTGMTMAAEGVEVQYDPAVVSLEFLIELYFKSIDPTSLNRQGGDKGTQYRTGIYYTNAEQQHIIIDTVTRLAKDYDRHVVVEIMQLKIIQKKRLVICQMDLLY